MYKKIKIAELLGRVFKEVKRQGGKLSFIDSLGNQIVMRHDQECCEEVYLESIDGDLDWLLNNPILVAEEVSEVDKGPFDINGYCDTGTWTFYKLGTIQGVCTIRWFGTSNGCYSESADLFEYKAEETK